MFTKTPGYKDSSGKFHVLIEDAQAAEIAILLDEGGITNSGMEIAKKLVSKCDKVIEILTVKPDGKPRARNKDGKPRKKREVKAKKAAPQPELVEA